MARNLDDLANMLEAKAKSIAVINSSRAVETATILLRKLIEATPVDTTTALSNWQVELMNPKRAFISAYVPGFLGYTTSQSAAQALSVGIAAMENKKPGESIFISNNAPYISNLNAGTSKQAPAGFVELQIMVTRQLIPAFKFEK